MKVFLSWSKERSRQVAELLDDWIQNVIQVVNPWMSSKDIDRGSLWFTEIGEHLSTISVGIVCITKENKDNPWILFEAGALAKGLSSSRICTFLIDLQPKDIEDPLAQFNHTLPNKESLWTLMLTINKTLGDSALSHERLRTAFDTYWTDFDKKFKQIIKDTKEGTVAPKEERTTDEMMSEMLSTVRGLDRRMRKMESGSVEKAKIQPRASNPVLLMFNILKKDIDTVEKLSGKYALSLSKEAIENGYVEMSGITSRYNAETFLENLLRENVLYVDRKLVEL